jgi:predicted RNA methylase
MLAIARLERRRLAVQQLQDQARSAPQRNRLGQFATPGPLALAMLQHARHLLPAGALRFLDPAIGTGAFYSALLRVFPMRRIRAATGFEVDAHYGAACNRVWSGTPLQLRHQDFTAATPPASAPRRFNLLVCNPPYVRHHHLRRDDKLRLQQLALRASGTRLGGLAGLYTHFMAIAHPWMSPGAIAGWLIPSEFMDVNYGVALKRYLLREVTLLQVHRFDPSECQFSDALVSSAIVWLQAQPPPPGHEVQFSFGGSLEHPQSCAKVTLGQLQPEAKWSGIPIASAAPRPAIERSAMRTAGISVGALFRVTRGIATGANEYFIMTGDQAAERGIPRQCLRPILPPARRLPDDEVLADDDGAPLLTRRLWLLDCRLPDDQIRAYHPRLWRYLEQGRAAFGGGYLCSRRAPWFLQERREPTAFLCTYMTRGGGRFIFNHSRAIVANTYLMLYPRERLARYIGADPARARCVWQALKSIESAALRLGGRVYGGGLYKLEPRELSAIPAPEVAALLS